MAKKKVILVDADVISHFIATGRIDYLSPILAPHTIYVVEQVYDEAAYHPFYDNRKQELDNWMKNFGILKIPFPSANKQIRLEYYRLKKESPRFGNGERACMAIARYNKEVIASSNFRDVADYCKKYEIEHLGVLDILTIALRKGIFDAIVCNKFIHDAMIINEAKFPVSTIEEYKTNKHLDDF